MIYTGGGLHIEGVSPQQFSQQHVTPRFQKSGKRGFMIHVNMYSRVHMHVGGAIVVGLY